MTDAHIPTGTGWPAQASTPKQRTDAITDARNAIDEVIADIVLNNDMDAEMTIAVIADLVEYLNRVVVVELADKKALTVLAMREHLDVWEIATRTSLSAQQVRKLLTRAHTAQRMAQSEGSSA